MSSSAPASSPLLRWLSAGAARHHQHRPCTFKSILLMLYTDSRFRQYPLAPRRVGQPPGFQPAAHGSEALDAPRIMR